MSSENAAKIRFYGYLSIDRKTGCHIWTAAQNGTGYGIFNFCGKPTLANRLAWEFAFGKISDGLCVLHKCDVRACCNPDHLFLGTRSENSRDMVLKNRSAKHEKHSQAKLSEYEVTTIRALHESGNMSQRSIARQFGVCHGTIQCVISGKTWV